MSANVKRFLSPFFLLSLILLLIMTGCSSPSDPGSGSGAGGGNPTKTTAEVINDNILISGIARNVTIRGSIDSANYDIALTASTGAFEAYEPANRAVLSRTADDSTAIKMTGTFFYCEALEDSDSGELLFEVTSQVGSDGQLVALATSTYYQAEADLLAINENALRDAEDNPNDQSILNETETITDTITGESITQTVFTQKKSRSAAYMESILRDFKKTAVVDLPENVGACPFIVGKTYYYQDSAVQHQDYLNTFTYKGFGLIEMNKLEYSAGSKSQHKKYKCSWNTETSTLYMALTEKDGLNYEDILALTTDIDALRAYYLDTYTVMINSMLEEYSRDEALEMMGVSEDAVAGMSEEELVSFIVKLQIKTILEFSNLELPEEDTLDAYLDVYVSYCFEFNTFQEALEQFSKKVIYRYNLNSGIQLSTALPEPFSMRTLLDEYDIYDFDTNHIHGEYSFQFQDDRIIYWYIPQSGSTERARYALTLNGNTLHAVIASPATEHFPQSMDLSFTVTGSGNSISITFTGMNNSLDSHESYTCEYMPHTQSYPLEAPPVWAQGLQPQP